MVPDVDHGKHGFCWEKTAHAMGSHCGLWDDHRFVIQQYPSSYLHLCTYYGRPDQHLDDILTCIDTFLRLQAVVEGLRLQVQES